MKSGPTYGLLSVCWPHFNTFKDIMYSMTKFSFFVKVIYEVRDYRE